MTEKNIHEGRNVKRIREILGIKQDALAFDLGINQQAISLLEQREALDKDTLQKISNIFKVPVEAIKNFDAEDTVNIIGNTFHDEASASAYSNNYHKCNFNPLDKYVEQVEKNEKLYEALLKSEREKIVLLEKLIAKK
ncbi:MAG: helix-turn-helix transcriptional regulator [Bacteroidota bacterium]